MQQAGLALLGDFNVKYGNGDNKDARDFTALLEDSNLIELVSSATHVKGNIRDQGPYAWRTYSLLFR